MIEEDEKVVLKEQPKLSDRDYFEKMAAELGLEQVTNEDLEPTTT